MWIPFRSRAEGRGASNPEVMTAIIDHDGDETCSVGGLRVVGGPARFTVPDQPFVQDLEIRAMC